jgi:hypothetical protein
MPARSSLRCERIAKPVTSLIRGQHLKPRIRQADAEGMRRIGTTHLFVLRP